MADITLDGLGKRFGAVTAVENLSLEIKPGNVTAFLGPNGAGKTTTMRMVLGLVRPTSGHRRRPPGSASGRDRLTLRRQALG